MSNSVLIDVLLTVIGSILTYFIATSPRIPFSKAGKIVAVVVPIALLMYNQKLWSQTHAGIVEHISCSYLTKSPACIELSESMYKNGNDLMLDGSDPDLATWLHRQSCNRDYMPSCIALGSILESGYSGKPRFAEALSLYKLACGRGEDDACSRARGLENNTEISGVRLQ